MSGINFRNAIICVFHDVKCIIKEKSDILRTQIKNQEEVL